MEVHELLKRFNEEVFGEGRIALTDELVHPEFVDHTAVQGIPPDREGLKGFVETVHGAFGDTHATMERIIVSDDQVAWRWRMTAKHTGEFMGIAATGNEIEITGNDLGVMRDGKLAEMWSEMDMLSLMAQLGAVEMPGR